MVYIRRLSDAGLDLVDHARVDENARVERRIHVRHKRALLSVILCIQAARLMHTIEAQAQIMSQFRASLNSVMRKAVGKVGPLTLRYASAG